MSKYDYLVVGCGMFGATFAQQVFGCKKDVLVIEKRSHIGGNCYTENVEGINVHKYGPHIFHTDSERVWEYVNQFAEFNNFINRPKVNYQGRIFSFPINLMTLYQLWGVSSPVEAKRMLDKAAISNICPKNLEEWILAKTGREIYETFIKGYTRKQWGKAPSELPVDIIERIPIRLTFNDNYFEDRFQGIPVGGYTKLFEKMLDGIEVQLNTDYFENPAYWRSFAETVVFTGKIDEYFDYKFGELEYRSLGFENKIFDGDYQGNAVINYTDSDVPYTRTIEHKHFEFGKQRRTIVTWEFPYGYTRDEIPFYPVNTRQNNILYARYAKEAERENEVIFAGRLGSYKYLDMDDVILAAMNLAEEAVSGSGR